jgi:hypothetical protein
MRSNSVLKITVLMPCVLGVLGGAACAWGQESTQPRVAQGLPPRATPGDYQAQAKVGPVTIAAEFMGHAVPTAQATFNTEEYVAVETGLFGPAGARVTLATGDFSLRINGKKVPLPSQPYGVILKSLKDPEWEAEQASTSATKSKTGINTGGGGGGAAEDKPAPPKMSIGVQRAMEQKVEKASFPEGDRVLPQAGLIFFQYSGKVKSIHSLELIYAGAAGKATLTLQP